MSFPYMLSSRTLTVIIDGSAYQTDRSNPYWDKIKVALTNPNTTAGEMIGYMQPINAIASAVAGSSVIQVIAGKVYFQGTEIHTALTDRILDICSEGLDVEPWIRFATNVYANPYDWSREELFLFLERANLPITPDGCFIAYKKVRDDYLDIHSASISNAVGELVVMPGGREDVDPNRNNTCSVGLHFCSKDYLPHFGSGPGTRVVLIKINPADVVSIPADYSNTKGRCWRYEVVGEMPESEVHQYQWAAVSPSYNDYEWGYVESVNDDDTDDLGLWAHWDSTDDTDDEVLDVEVVEEPFVETVGNGTITKDSFLDMVRTHGTLAGIARACGVSSGTVQAWKTKLFGPANT